jgi:hypothetical protein
LGRKETIEIPPAYFARTRDRVNETAIIHVCFAAARQGAGNGRRILMCDESGTERDKAAHARRQARKEAEEIIEKARFSPAAPRIGEGKPRGGATAV